MTTMHQRFSRAACRALLAAAAACAPRAAPPPTPPHVPAAQTAPSPASCPRVRRARRMWSGFAVDVPSSAMHLALEVIVPIQDVLTELFCAPQRAACRPSGLLSIELADAEGSSAHLLLETAAGQAPAALELRAQGDEWLVDAASLESYLTACRPR